MTNSDSPPTADWPVADPESAGVDPAYLSTLQDELEVCFSSINGLVMVVRGQVVFEWYNNGFGPHDAHHVASVTKSVTSALVGIAIDRGHIEGVRQRVLDFFPEVTAQDPLKQELTIEHLLTMTAGFLWHTGARAYEPMLERMAHSPNWVAFILDLPVLARSFGSFQYNSAGSHLLSAILTRATGRCAREFAIEHLFARLGIAELPATAPAAGASETGVPETDMPGATGPQSSSGPTWPTDPQGHTTGGWGLALSPRELARFGLLYLNGGRWQGRQVVSQAWVDASIAPHTPGYGYQWWLRHLDGIFVYAAVGRGGHHIFCVPERQIVVAIASQPAGRWRDRWPLLLDYIIPSVTV